MFLSIGHQSIYAVIINTNFYIIVNCVLKIAVIIKCKTTVPCRITHLFHKTTVHYKNKSSLFHLGFSSDNKLTTKILFSRFYLDPDFYLSTNKVIISFPIS